MRTPSYRAKIRLLCLLFLIAVAYLAWLHDPRSLARMSLMYGSLGIVLGLYICSHPAANAIDVLFFDRGAVRRMLHAWSGIGWLALNLAVLLVGWLLIAVGATRFGKPTG